MKIVKRGVDPKDKEIHQKCSKCKTEFTYTQSDVQYDFRDGDYVICPVCGSFIAHGDLPRSVNRATDC